MWEFVGDGTPYWRSNRYETDIRVDRIIKCKIGHVEDMGNSMVSHRAELEL